MPILSISRLNDRWTSSVILTSAVRLTSNVRGLVVGSKLVQHIQCEIGLGSCSRSVSRTYNGISGSFYPADNRFKLVYCLFYMYAPVTCRSNFPFMKCSCLGFLVQHEVLYISRHLQWILGAISSPSSLTGGTHKLVEHMPVMWWGT